MSCRKAYELDLAGFLADPRGATWAEFRDHYPRCPTCAAEVRAWTELELALGAAAHPDPDDLVRWVDAPGVLAPRTRHAIAEHLAACAACRDEAHTLRTFDPLVERAAVPRPLPARSSALRGLGRLVWNPVFAYAVALLVGLYPLLSGRVATPPVAVEKRSLGERPPAPAAPPGAEARAKGKEEAPAPRQPPAPALDEALDEELAKAERELDEAPRPRVAAPANEPTGAGSVSPPPAGTLADAGRTAERKDAGAAAGALASTARLASGGETVILVRPDAETTATIAPGTTEIVLRFDPLPPEARAVGVAASDPERLLGERPLDGDRARVPASWLAAGRYTLTLRAGEAVVATARLRVTAP